MGLYRGGVEEARVLGLEEGFGGMQRMWYLIDSLVSCMHSRTALNVGIVVCSSKQIKFRSKVHSSYIIDHINLPLCLSEVSKLM